MIHYVKRRATLELNMAPMIDMVFLLIIFFLTATTFTEREREQDVLLPSNRNAGSLSRSADSSLIVNVLADGRIRVLGGDVSPSELVALVVARQERARGGLKVQLRADRRAVYEDVARALEAIERGGVAKPHLVTKLVELSES